MVGASPNFSEVHIIRTLILLNKREIGRKRLVKELGIGEGSVRTILKRLRNDNLVKSDTRGQMPSKKGRGYIQKYLRKFSAPRELKQTDIGFGSVIIVHKKADRIKTGFEQRDIAVSAGSESVLILKYKNGKLEFPTKDVRLSDFPDLIEGLKEFNPKFSEFRSFDFAKQNRIKFRDGDVVVLSFAKTYPMAEDGAVAVALDLIR